jgi:hypothetical protein
MVLILKNPYLDDEVLVDADSSKVVEQLLHDALNANPIVGIDTDKDIAWGEYGQEILSSNCPITLRCYVYLQTSDRLNWNGSRYEFTDNMNIEIWVVNPDSIGRYSRDPRAFALMHFIRQFIIVNQNKEQKGIFELRWQFGNVENDSVKPDLTRARLTIQSIYVGDIIDE